MTTGHLQTGKRNHSNSSKLSSPKITISNKNKKLFSITNRYEALAQTEHINTLIQKSSPEVSNTTDQIKLPPPIFVKGIIAYTDICSAISELIGTDNFFCKSSVDRLKIQTTNPESYRTLVHLKKNQNAEYHTYQLREDKPTRFIIRNLHPTTSTELIKSELEIRLYEVRKVINVIHKINKHPLPLFFVDLELTDHLNEIYKLSSLLHTKIKVKEPYKPKLISHTIVMNYLLV